MADIGFDRQAFAPTTAEPERKPAPNIFGMLAFVVVVGLAGVIGYKVFSQVSNNNQLNAANAQVQRLQAQIAEAQKQIEELEKHHKPAKIETPAPVVEHPLAAKTPGPRPAYHITAGSVLPPQPKPAKLQTASGGPDPGAAMKAETAALRTELTANHEAWKATTDRLADVVGVMGEQQNEITETRDAVNQLLSQTRRQAVSFELQRGNDQVPVGPVSLQLKNVDAKTQRYSVCVYVQEHCIELKNRVLNEVVVFVVSKDNGPLELVATKILHDQVVGYLQVPVEAHAH